MKRLYLIPFLIFITLQTQAQWSEFNYFVFKAGITNQFLNPSPSSGSGLFINTFGGDKELIPEKNKFLKYNQGFNIGMDFHFDWHNDMGGFIIGAEFHNFSVSNKFITERPDYYIIRTMTVYSASFPAMVKFGYEIFNLQRYAFVGVRMNWNFRMDLSEVASWNSVPRIKTYTQADNIYQPFSAVIVGGINFLFFNIEADLFPRSFLNKNYTINVGTDTAPFIIRPFETYPDYNFVINTTIYIPITPWTTTRSYFLNRLARMF